MRRSGNNSIDKPESGGTGQSRYFLSESQNQMFASVDLEKEQDSDRGIGDNESPVYSPYKQNMSQDNIVR